MLCCLGQIAQSDIAINVSLAFCMGADLDSIMNSPLGQPMAQIFFNSFGRTGTLVVWVSICSPRRSYLCPNLFLNTSHLGCCCRNPVCGDFYFRAATLLNFSKVYDGFQHGTTEIPDSELAPRLNVHSIGPCSVSSNLCILKRQCPLYLTGSTV